MTAPGLGGDWRRLRRVVLERDGYRCHWCGAPATQVDHLLERALGGANTLSNLVASCQPCNGKRGGALGARRRRARSRARAGHPFFYPQAAATPALVDPLSPPAARRPGVVTDDRR